MSSEEKFAFVQSLAADLNRGEVALPSFPDVVMRIRKALDDPDCNSESLAAIVGTDPVLASRILMYANSSYYNAAGVKIASLNAAIGRIGFERLRTTAITYAVEQLHTSKDLDAMRGELQVTWKESLRTAAMAQALAESNEDLDAEAAFVAGLLSRVGSLYVFTKHGQFPDLIGDEEARADLIADWEGPIGESIVANWDFPEEIVATFNPDSDCQQNRHVAILTDAIVCARRSLGESSVILESSLELSRLKIEENQFDSVIENYKIKLDTLTSALA
ncbi:MAG: HDOD domain-containing protein [Pseudomonadota bacterium]